MRYYSVKVSYTGNIWWTELISCPVDMIMKIEDDHAAYMEGQWESPKGTYNNIRYIEQWEYDMLDAFGVPTIKPEDITDVFGED